TSSSREVVVSLLQSPSRFVEKVPYITAPGRTVRTVVSDLGVYEKEGESDALRLAGLLGDKPEADAVAAARAACGWGLQVAPQLRRLRAPTARRARPVPPLRPTPLLPWPLRCLSHSLSPQGRGRGEGVKATPLPQGRG